MAHTMWKGTFTIGLASVPVKMHTAADDREFSFTKINVETGNPIAYRMVDRETGESVAGAQIVRGLAVGDGHIVITDEELANIKLKGTKNIDILATVRRDHLDDRYIRKAYWLSPDGAPGVKGYALMAQALHKTNRAALGTIVLRDTDWACTVTSPDGTRLMLTTLNWHTQMREVPDVAGAEVDTTLLDMAINLVEGMADDALDFTAMTGEYQEALRTVVTTRSTEHLSTATTTEPTSSTDNPVEDLMNALKASIAAQMATEQRAASGV